MYTDFSWTKRTHEEGNWCVTERIVTSYGIVEEHDWCFYDRSMTTYIEAVAEILDRYPNAKFDPFTDNWYLSMDHDFIIWNSAIYSGPHGETYEMFEDNEAYEIYDYMNNHIYNVDDIYFEEEET